MHIACCHIPTYREFDPGGLGHRRAIMCPHARCLNDAAKIFNGAFQHVDRPVAELTSVVGQRRPGGERKETRQAKGERETNEGTPIK